MKVFIRFTYENVNVRFTTVRKYGVPLSALVSLSLTLQDSVSLARSWNEI